MRSSGLAQKFSALLAEADDLTRHGAKFGNPTIFVSLVEWAD
jgi:hypothetical protein